jgi:hypothetical protein
MQEESRKAESRGGKGEEERLGSGRSNGPDRSNRIDEYNFFIARDEETQEEGVPEEKAKKRRVKTGTRT